MTNLERKYNEWRELTEENNLGSIDCGEAQVREDFSNYVELEEYISFTKMFELEKNYSK